MAQYINFTPEQKERAAIVDLEEFLRRQGENLIKSGREKRLASDHSVTVNGCEWFDHATQTGGRAVSFVQKFYGKSYPEAVTMLLGENMDTAYPLAEKREAPEPKPFAPPMKKLQAFLRRKNTCSLKSFLPARCACFIK